MYEENPVISTTHGADKLRTPKGIAAVIVLLLLCALLMKVMGLMGGLLFVALPIGIAVMAIIILKPIVGLNLSLVMGFLSAGLARYVAAPWGLTLDIFMFLAWLGFLFKRNKPKGFWDPLNDDIVKAWLIWFFYIMFELVNPEAHSPVAWFYAMRGIGFYQLLGITLVLMVARTPKYLETIINYIIWFSIAGTLWGLRQLIFGVDDAEYYWLWVEDHQDEHILHGKLRVFSYYSDAGQFGSSQAMVAMMCGILAIGPEKGKRKILYIVAALLTFIGFGISGTRGALAVPAVGVIVYLITSRNFKLLAMGVIAIGVVFYILKFTFMFQGVEQVARMRTALNPDDPSLQTRLSNQRKFGAYLRSRPFGGGIGTAGFWGERFSPHTFLAQTATDSWYVKIWAENGIVGLCIHVGVLAFTLGKAGVIVWRLRNPILRQKMLAFYASIAGIIFSSYGNQVFGQMPTGMIMAVMIPLMFLAPQWDDPPPEDKKS
jgi:hypothetical protein